MITKRRHSLPFSSTALVLAGVLACTTDRDNADGAANDAASDGGSGEPTLADRLHELADCEPTDAVYLLPWTGPAFDPATGELVEPLPAGHVEAVVNGWRRRDGEAQALRVEHGMATAGDVFARDGLLGFQGVESDLCDISISHTLWRDEASMYAFVIGEAHARAMSGASKMHHAVAGAHWTNDALDSAPTWQAAVKRLAEERLGTME